MNHKHKLATAIALTTFGITPYSSLANDQIGFVLEEIIVTAERRSASVQETAAAITAHSGEKLEQMGVVSPEGLSVTTPSLHTTNGGGYMQFYVRGVGSFGSNAFAENAVSFNVDGVYVSRAETYQGLFYDLERVEVLKGPQGTLYGRNSTGGAINLLSRRPEIGGDTSGYVTVEVGNYDLRQINGAVNIPVSDQLALRAALQTVERDGYFDDGTEDADSTSFRLSSLYDNDSFSALIVADIQRVDRVGPGSTVSGPSSAVSGDFLDNGDPWSTGYLSDAVDQLLTNPANFPFSRGSLGQGTALSPNPGFDLDAFSLMAELNWETDVGRFTLLPSYRESEIDNVNYNPGFLIDTYSESDQTSIEFRWAHSAGKLDWVAGAFYFDESIDNDAFYFQDIPFFNQVNIPGYETVNSTIFDLALETDALAIFGEATYALTDKFSVKLGARYTQEEKSMAGSAVATSPTGPVPPFADRAVLALQGDNVDDDQVTWKLALEYDIDQNNFVYFSVGTGFKAGGYYAEQVQFENTFDSETITAYSLGSKSTLFDGQLRVNAELFYWDYKDHQESHLADSPGGYSLFITENIGQATMQGLDLEVDYLLTSKDRLSLQAQLLDASFDEFSYSAYSPVGPPNTGCNALPVAGSSDYVIDCDGKDAIRAPQWSFSLSYEHVFDLGDNGELALNLRTSVADESYVSIDYLPSQLADSYTRTDVYLGYTSPTAKWNAALWGRNLENDATITGGFVSPFTDITFSSLMAPRTFGANIQYNF